MTSPWGSDRLDAGSSFGNYEIVRCLGAGAFGTVYEALRLPLRRRVALKVLHRQHVLNASLVERFLREGEVVARLDHPHIVSVFDLGVHDEQPYLAMEMLQGETLGAALQAEGAMPIEEAVDLMLAVMSGVAAVHDQGVVHRDLKPENIFLARLPTGEAQPKLLDFGIAKVLESDRSLTQSNAMMGTPCYMSPEQAHESKNVDAQSDQWSLAVILFELLTGRGPFEGDNLLAVLTAITARPLPRLREHIPSAPEGLEAVLLRAMTRTPAGRWPSVREFGAALLPFATAGARARWGAFYGQPGSTLLQRRSRDEVATADTLPEQPGTLEPSVSLAIPRPAGARTKGGLAAAALATLALLGGGAIALSRRTAPAPSPPHAAAVAVAAPRPTPVALSATEPPAPPAVEPDPRAAAAPVLVPAVAAVAARDPQPALRQRGTRRRRSPRAPVCPNGICPP